MRTLLCMGGRFRDRIFGRIVKICSRTVWGSFPWLSLSYDGAFSYPPVINLFHSFLAK